MLCVERGLYKKGTKSHKTFKNSLYKSKDPSLSPIGFGRET